MIKLDDTNLMSFENHSSKGNQLKWKLGDVWYKADYTGYEGLTEYVTSQLLNMTSLSKAEFIKYETEQILYKHTEFNGCKSYDFIGDDWQIITLERLYKSKYNRVFMQDVWKIKNVSDRLVFLVEQVEKLTGIVDFGEYISKMLTIDAFFLNEDRHLHNVAVLMNDEGKMMTCPFFDHGAGLLSDTTVDYPLGVDAIQLIGEVNGKTVCESFDEAMDEAERLFGRHIKFEFTKRDVKNILDEISLYSDEIKRRVELIIYQQIRKYGYLFS